MQDKEWEESASEMGPTEKTENESLLESCTPAINPHRATLSGERRIRRFELDEPFTTVGTPVILCVAIKREASSGGFYSGEQYHPIPVHLQADLRRISRQVAFHACVGRTGPFILPQKLDPPGAPPNSWNQSLANALAHPPGQWRKVWVDRDLERYRCDLISSPVEGDPEYPDFKEDLERALKPNIVDRVDHPVVQQILDARNRRNREIDDLDERIYE
jgi:hypothetical protein